jgi:hypothetical protein
MARGRHIAVLLVALLVAVALPTAAIAQSAGEDQYTDPLQGGGAGGGNGGGSGGGGSSGGGGGGGNAPTTQAQSDTAPAADTAKPAQAADDSDGGLPNTGFPIAILLGSGLILLSTGLALRRTA